jgi:hypothetical protein
MRVVDFRKAFNSINRKRLYEVMEWMKIPSKLITLTQVTMNTTQAKVKIGNKLSANFEFNARVKWDGLSVALFIVALHSLIKTIGQIGTIYTKSSQICAYTYDNFIITRSREKIIGIYKETEEKARKIGLEVNERKTKYMIMLTSQSRRKPQDLKVERKLFTGVSSFKYLGNTINNGNRNDNCIKERIQAGNRAYFTELRTLESKIISKAGKIEV